MRQVAVTEGDKVEAQIRLGVEVNGYGVGELEHASKRSATPKSTASSAEYDEQYRMAAGAAPRGPQREALRYAARIELGLRAFLDSGSFKAFTDTFEDLGGLAQLPGLAVQRLMADGYGFGAEGDWKTAALLRAMKVMAAGLPGGTSFMEDYTYHLDPAGPLVLGAHMLEVCPSLAAGKPVVRNPSPGDRRQGRSRAAGLHRAGGTGGERGDARPGRSLPPAGQRGRRRGAAAVAAAPRRPGGLVAAARLPNGGGGLDLRRRPAPHCLQPGFIARTP